MAAFVAPAVESRLTALFESDPTAMADPFPLFRELREAAPVYEFAYGTVVTTYADVKSVIEDTRRYSNNPYNKRARVPLDAATQHAHDELVRYQAMHLGMSDGDQHQRLRRIAHRTFTPRHVAQLEDNMRRYVDELLTPLAGDEVVDFTDFAFRFPLMIIGDLLGVPMADREQVQAWSATIGRFLTGIVEPEPVLAAHRATRDFLAYLHGLVNEQREGPRDGVSDLVVELISAEDEERLSLEELMVMIMMFLFAGHETTGNLLGNGVLALLTERGEWEVLCADPGLAADATEELLRYTTPAQWLARTPLVDVELSGVSVAAGSYVLPMLAAGNRDPAVFAHPDELDIRRANSRQHLGLGFGPHFCLGQAIARAEGTIVFRELARRFPDIELAADEFSWTGSALLRKLVCLPVKFGADRGRT